jgi:hypothetical protein
MNDFLLFLPKLIDDLIASRFFKLGALLPSNNYLHFFLPSFISSLITHKDKDTGTRLALNGTAATTHTTNTHYTPDTTFFLLFSPVFPQQ